MKPCELLSRAARRTPEETRSLSGVGCSQCSCAASTYFARLLSK